MTDEQLTAIEARRNAMDEDAMCLADVRCLFRAEWANLDIEDWFPPEYSEAYRDVVEKALEVALLPFRLERRE